MKLNRLTSGIYQAVDTIPPDDRSGKVFIGGKLKDEKVQLAQIGVNRHKITNVIFGELTLEEGRGWLTLEEFENSIDNIEEHMAINGQLFVVHKNQKEFYMPVGVGLYGGRDFHYIEIEFMQLEDIVSRNPQEALQEAMNINEVLGEKP